MEMVLNNKGYFMTERVKIDQDWSDNFKVKVVANGRLMPITMLTFVIAVATMSVMMSVKNFFIVYIYKLLLRGYEDS